MPRAVLAADTAAMGAGEAAPIAAALIAAGKPPGTPAVVVENAAWLPDRNVVCGTLQELPRMCAQGKGGPALILLGDVFREAQMGTYPILVAQAL